MSSTIAKVNQLELMPEHLRASPHHMALGKAIDAQFFKLLSQVEVLNLYASIDKCSEDVLDVLADEESLVFYDRSLSADTKRQLIEKGLIFHMKSGTPSAVEELINIVFGDGKVVEWFEYAGDPYHFKVTTSNSEATTSKAVEFIRAINAYKNLRSVLEKVEIESTSSVNFYVGAGVQSADIYTIRQVI